jgi:hypothetical protein
MVISQDAAIAHNVFPGRPGDLYTGSITDNQGIFNCQL